MGASSGTYRFVEVEPRDCDDCGWTGDVDVDFDPEIHTAWWNCPRCGREVEES